MQSFEIFIANRYLKTRKKGAFIRMMTRFAVFGIAIGVFAMIVTTAVMNGFRDEIQKNLFSATAHFTIASIKEEIPNTNDTIQLIRSINGVVAASPIRIDHGLIKSNNRNTPSAPLVIKAVDPQSAHSTSSIFDSLKPVNIEQLKEGEILIGSDLAKNINAQIGDLVTAVFLRTELGLYGLQPKMANFKIAGLFQSNISEYDSHWAFIHIKDAMKLANSDQAEMIEIRTFNVDAITQVKLAVLNILNSKNTQSFFAQDLRDTNKALFAALRVEKWIFGVIFAFIVIIAMFNTIGTLTLLVTEKRKDLGILLALGATPKQIQRIFEFQGLYIGALGTALGLGFAIPFCIVANHYQLVKLPMSVYDFITFIPFHLNALDILLIAIFPLVVSWIASRYPAKHAARLDPIKAIKSD